MCLTVLHLELQVVDFPTPKQFWQYLLYYKITSRFYPSWSGDGKDSIARRIIQELSWI